MDEVTKDPRFKHTAPAATAAEIKKSLKITPEDEKVAKEVLEKVTTRKKRKVGTKPKGSVIPAKTDEQKEDEAKKKAAMKVSQERIDKLNEAANFMLSCLEPTIAADWHQAAEEQKVMDVGIYVLGVLNRLSKMVDYWEIDIEPDWEQGMIGYNEHLFCDFCKKEITITKDTHLRQKFCSNICAKRYRAANTTGILYPTTNPGPDEAAIEKKQWMHEAKREGVING